jgi:hypothetical protein
MVAPTDFTRLLQGNSYGTSATLSNGYGQCSEFININSFGKYNSIGYAPDTPEGILTYALHTKRAVRKIMGYVTQQLQFLNTYSPLVQNYSVVGFNTSTEINDLGLSANGNRFLAGIVFYENGNSGSLGVVGQNVSVGPCGADSADQLRTADAKLAARQRRRLGDQIERAPLSTAGLYSILCVCRDDCLCLVRVETQPARVPFQTHTSTPGSSRCNRPSILASWRPSRPSRLTSCR